MITSEGGITGRLVIDQISVPGGGEVGMTHCPGRNDLDVIGRQWNRNLTADLEAIKTWPATMLISLIEEPDFDRLGVAGLGDAARAIGLTWHHLPIKNMHPPDERFERAWQRISGTINQLFTRQERLVMHCGEGFGRTGTLAARLLIDHGISAAEAIKTVRAARPRTIESASQEDYLMGYRPGGHVP